MARRPDSGAFDTPVALLRRTAGRDAMNAPVETFAVFARALASREPAGGAEALRAAQAAGVAVERFLIRATPKVMDVSARDQMTCGGVTYGLERVEPVTGQGRRGRYIRLHAVAQADLDLGDL